MDNLDNNQPQFIFRKERDFGEIISDSFSFFSQNYKVLGTLFLKYIGPFVLLGVLGNVYYQYKIGDVFGDVFQLVQNNEMVANLLFENVPAFLFFLATTLITSIVLYTTVLHCIKSYINNNGEIVESDVSTGIKKDFLPVLGFSIINGILSSIGLLFCILPGIYLYVVLVPGIALIVMEDISVSDAFSKCFKLIKDNWWITFATIVIFSILIGILGYIFQLPATIYTFVEGFTGFDGSQQDAMAFTEIYTDWVYLLFAAIGVIGQYFLTLFTVIMFALIYFNLSEKQEFTGTYNQIDNIGN